MSSLPFASSDSPGSARPEGPVRRLLGINRPPAPVWTGTSVHLLHLSYEKQFREQKFAAALTAHALDYARPASSPQGRDVDKSWPIRDT